MKTDRNTGPGVDIMAGNLQQIQALDQMKKDMLRQLLKEQLQGTERVLVRRAHMGSNDSYLGTASFRWIDNHVSMFNQLPLFTRKLDENGNIVIDEETIELLQQRTPDWSRQDVLTLYLLRQENRKFPPMLVVVYEDWVDDPEAAQWDEDGRATVSSWPVEYLDELGIVAILDFGRRGVRIYVIDGQHRLLGIKGVMELLKSGRFKVKNRKGKDLRILTRQDLVNMYGLEDITLDGIGDDQMGIEFIPAVMKGETREEARIRVRSVFVHVNKTLQPPVQGEQVLLDEDDGFSILSRRVALKHSLLKKDMPGDRVNWKGTALPAGSIKLTAATILKSMAASFLGGNANYSAWRAKNKEVAIRPSNAQLVEGEEEMMQLLDHMATLPSFTAIQQGENIDAWREFPPDGKGHLLMRPLGQLILAEAVGYLHQDENGPKIPLDKIFAKLKKFDANGGFQDVVKPKSVWYGITYNPHRRTMSMEGREVGGLLLRHLVDGFKGLDEKERDTLQQKFRDARSFELENGTVSAFNLDGKQVEPKDVSLPPMI